MPAAVEQMFIFLHKKPEEMKRLFCIFGIRREERWLAVFMLVALAALNALVLCKYYDLFTPIKKWYWPLFIHNFHISGFDPITYSVVSDWTAGYNIYRHPLLAFYMYLPYLLNQGLMWATGINCAIFIVAAIQMFCAFYSSIFAHRILRDVVGLSCADSTLLTLFLFSFAYVMVSAIVPDHFIMSMMLLLLALWVSGRRMKSGRPLKTWQVVAYFLLTAGTSLNNGLKIFLSALFVNGRGFFRLRFLLLGVILPSALIWGTARVGYAKLVWPREMAQKKAKAEKKAREQQKAREAEAARMKADSLHADSLRRGGAWLSAVPESDTAKVAKAPKAAPAAQQKTPAKAKRVRQGKPITDGEFMRWTDITTSRWQSAVENLFGESIQLHSRHLLEDEFRARPMIVHYTSWVSYAVELLVVLLFAAGIWCARRSRFFWLCMSWFALDMMLHMVLGFGINEVYIMSAHWIFVIPVAAGFVLLGAHGAWRRVSRCGVALLTVYLWVYNVSLIVKYLTA